MQERVAENYDHAQVLFATGDCVAQQLVEKRGLQNHDIMRTARMGAYGGCMFSFSFSGTNIYEKGSSNLSTCANL